MDPVTASILLGAATNVAGFGLKKFMGAGRPEYEIPDSAKQALATARILQADQYMPGEQKAMDRAGVSSANAVAAAREGGNILESISGIQGQYDKTSQDILARSEADQRNDQERLMRQLGLMSQYKDQEWQMNEFAPYAENQQETRDLVGALSTNVSNALLHQGLKTGGSGWITPGTENEATEGIQPASEEVGEYGSSSSLTAYPGFGSFVSGSPREYTTPGSMPTIPGLPGMTPEQLAKLLQALQVGIK